jgi:monomeric isocitrate dehydrogenase
VFGHCVKVFYKDAFAKHQKVLDELGVNVNNGMSDLYDKIEALPASQRAVITLRDVEGCESQEVCDMLGISEANQRVLLHRARSKVRTALEQYFQPGATR